MRAPDRAKWPKEIVPLNPAEMQILADWRTFWHTELGAKFGIFDFYSASFLRHVGGREGRRFSNTLEIGPGLTGASTFLDGVRSVALELDPVFAAELRARLPGCDIRVGDIQGETDLETARYDRVVAMHVLEHLPNLPAALAQVKRILTDDGVLDVVIPCEGGFLYSIGRRFTTARHFKRKFGENFDRFIAQDHVNTAREIVDLLEREFRVTWSAYYPFIIPTPDVNLCIGLRLQKR